MIKKLALAYLVAGLVWIAISDWALHKAALWLSLNEATVYWISNWKGYFFVIITAILLNWYMHRIIGRNRKNVRQFRQLFEANPNPMWVYDTQTLTILAVNQAAINQYGYSRQEFLQMSIADIRPKEDLPALRRNLQEETGSYSVSGLWRHKRRNGDIFYVKIYSNATEYNNRQARLVMAFNVNEAVLAEEENKLLTSRLTQKQNYLQSLIESQTTYLIRTDQQGRYTFANKTFCQKRGFNPESVYNLVFTSFASPEQQEQFQEVIIQCTQHPGTVIPYRLQEDTKAGIQISEWEFVAIPDESGKVTELQGVGQDVTEKIQTEEKVKIYAQRINDILESITDGFYAVDKDWNFTYVNTTFERILKRHRDELIGTCLWEQFPDAQALKFYGEYHRAVREQVKVHFEEFYPPTNSWYYLSAYPTSDGLTIYFQDITAAKLAQDKDFEDTQNLNALINNTTSLIWSVNSRYELMSANQPFLDTVAAQTGNTLQKGDSVLFPEYGESILQSWACLYQRALKGEQYTVEDVIDHPEKGLLYSEVSFNPIRDREGNIIGTGCFSNDITERKLHQLKIQEQNQKLKEIAWIQSHEVRVPVANILGLVNIFNYRHIDDPFNLEVLANLNQVTHELDLIIRKIVDKSNELDKEPTQPNGTSILPNNHINLQQK